MNEMKDGFVQHGKLRFRIINIKEGRAKLSIVGYGILDIAKVIGLNLQIELKELDLSNNYIKEISGLENLVNLRVLRLSSNQISETKGLEHLVNLEELYLNGNWIKEVEGLDNLTNLRVLDLSCNEITEPKALKNLTNLENMELKGNPIEEQRKEYENAMLSKLEKKISYLFHTLLAPDSEFFDIVGETFKLNPEFYMKIHYNNVRKRIKELYGAEKLKGMEKYILEKFCLYDGEQILYDFYGGVGQTLDRPKTGFVEPKPVIVGVSSGSIFVTNYRIIAQGELKEQGGRITFSELLMYEAGSSLRDEGKKGIIESSTLQEIPCYGYQFPIKRIR